MLMCDDTITLVQPCRGDDGETYVCTTISGASWYGKAVTEMTTKGAQPKNQYKCRIPKDSMPADVTPRAGDFVVHGVALDVRAAPRDLCAYEYFAVTAVGDNRRGVNPHWAVSGA